MWTFVELLLEVNLARNEEDLLGGFLALASRCGFVDSMARWWSLPLTLDLLNIMGHSLQKILCFKYRHSHFPLFNFFNCSFNIHKIPITLLSIYFCTFTAKRSFHFPIFLAKQHSLTGMLRFMPSSKWAEHILKKAKLHTRRQNH